MNQFENVIKNFLLVLPISLSEYSETDNTKFCGLGCQIVGLVRYSKNEPELNYTSWLENFNLAHNVRKIFFNCLYTSQSVHKLFHFSVLAQISQRRQKLRPVGRKISKVV